MERSTEVDFQYILQQKKTPKTNHFVISIIVMIEKCRNDLIEHYCKGPSSFCCPELRIIWRSELLKILSISLQIHGTPQQT